MPSSSASLRRRNRGADVFGYGVDVNENLDLIDLTTATMTRIGSTGAFLEGLAATSGGALFGTDDNGILYSVNPTTAVATAIGDTHLGDVEGLVFNVSTLLGSNFTNPTSVYTIDTATAASTLLVTTNPGEGVALRHGAVELHNGADRVGHPRQPIPGLDRPDERGDLLPRDHRSPHPRLRVGVGPGGFL